MSPKWLPLLIVLALLAIACGGDGSSPTPSPSPTSTGPALSPTPRQTPEPTPAVEKPDPQALVPAGYVLDQALEVSLDGSEAGQIVVISHTVAKDKTGQPVAAAPPDQCPDRDVRLGSLCAFRIEIFAYDPALGWTRGYVDEDENVGGLIEGAQASSFRVDAGGPEGLILTTVICAARCPVERHLVLAMKDSVIIEVYDAFEARLQLAPITAILDEPEYAAEDALCCPSARRITTIGLDPNTGEVGVIDVQIEPVGP